MSMWVADLMAPPGEVTPQLTGVHWFYAVAALALLVGGALFSLLGPWVWTWIADRRLADLPEGRLGPPSRS